MLSNSDNIMNPYAPHSSKTQEIEYFRMVDTINGYTNLLPNWDSYNANSISIHAIDKALEALNYLLRTGYLSNGIKVSVFPMRDGGVQFEFDGVNICAELEINPDGELTFIQFDDDGNILKSLQIFELTELSNLLEEA